MSEHQGGKGFKNGKGEMRWRIAGGWERGEGGGWEWEWEWEWVGGWVGRGEKRKGKRGKGKGKGRKEKKIPEHGNENHKRKKEEDKCGIGNECLGGNWGGGKNPIMQQLFLTAFKHIRFGTDGINRSGEMNFFFPFFLGRGREG